MSSAENGRSPRTLAFGACLLVWLGMALVVLLAELHQRNALQQQADGLGQALATQTSLLVTELLLANDLISMNVLLNELTRNTPVSEAAVFNIDDQIVAISGATAGVGTQRIGARLLPGSYVAPVALQDSIAGYVRINLDHSALVAGDRLYHGLLLAAALLMALLALSAMMALQRLPRSREEVTQWPSGQGQASAVLCLYISNHDALLEQHWDDTLPSLPERCEQLLVEVATLYDARIDRQQSPHLQLSFSRNGDASEQAFDALCCATLFMALSARLQQAESDTAALLIQAGLHMSYAGETTVISSETEAARVAALICEHGPSNGLLVSEQILAYADADNHFVLQPWQSLPDTEGGTDIQLYLLRSPAGATKALLQRQAAQLPS